MMRLALVPVVFLFLLPGYAYAQVLHVIDADVLKGIGPIAVGVESLPPDFESLGLRRDDIQRDTELKLRLAGIAIDVDESDFFYVSLGGLIGDNYFFFWRHRYIWCKSSPSMERSFPQVACTQYFVQEPLAESGVTYAEAFSVVERKSNCRSSVGSAFLQVPLQVFVVITYVFLTTNRCM